jgi:predicted glycoside hydrolase/deacetylase ChbG (UPF0249 family)
MPTTLERLGFMPDDRVAIVHADDIGMCHAANAALRQSWGYGLLTSCAVMAPCAWFPEAAALARATPGMDMGVHITLTSEWDSLRWGPVSTRDPASGLLDGEGYFWRSVPELVAHARPAAVAAEMRAQIEMALRAGIDVTHIDAHMGAALQPPFIEAYVGLAAEYRVPAFVPHLSDEALLRQGASPADRRLYRRLLDGMNAAGVPRIDHWFGAWGRAPETNLLQGFRAAFASVEPGITHLLCHPSLPGDELLAITSGRWLERVADAQAFQIPDFADYLNEIGVRRIGYRALRDLMRGA